MACSIEGSLLWHAIQIRSRADSLTSIAKANSNFSQPPDWSQLPPLNAGSVGWVLSGDAPMWIDHLLRHGLTHPVVFAFSTTSLNISARWLIYSCVQHVTSVGLFLQLWKPFCSVRTDLSRVCCFWDGFLAAPVFFSLFFLSFWKCWLRVTCFPLSFLSDLADNLVMDDFTFQEQLLTPRLATAGIGSASSAAAQLPGGYLLPTLSSVASTLLFCRHWPESPHSRHSCSPTMKSQKHFFKNRNQCKCQ